MTSSKNEASANLNSVPLPPPDARVVNTVCDYCIVGCSQKAIVWPVGEQGGVNAKANAYGVDFPVEQLTGQWVSPNQHSYCLVDGKKHHVVVHPDDSATVVNTLGNHSIRGGCIAQKVYNPEGLTKDRLQKPLLRVGGRLVPVSWDLALDVMVEVSRHILDKFGEAAWGMKTFSYQYFENTYAISKLAFESIQTPAYAPHDKPGPGNDTAGADDAGFQVFSASYDDWAKSEVIFISGCDPYETKTVLFTEWMMGAEPQIDSGAASQDDRCGVCREERWIVSANRSRNGHDSSPRLDSLDPGKRLGRQSICRKVGRQSMGDRRGVWARDSQYAVAVANDLGEVWGGA